MTVTQHQCDGVPVTSLDSGTPFVIAGEDSEHPIIYILLAKDTSIKKKGRQAVRCIQFHHLSRRPTFCLVGAGSLVRPVSIQQLTWTYE